MSKRGFSTEDELRVIKELLDGRYQVIHSKNEFKKLKDDFDYKSLIPGSIDLFNYSTNNVVYPLVESILTMLVTPKMMRLDALFSEQHKDPKNFLQALVDLKLPLWEIATFNRNLFNSVPCLYDRKHHWTYLFADLQLRNQLLEEDSRVISRGTFGLIMLGLLDQHNHLTNMIIHVDNFWEKLRDLFQVCIEVTCSTNEKKMKIVDSLPNMSSDRSWPRLMRLYAEAGYLDRISTQEASFLAKVATSLLLMPLLASTKIIYTAKTYQLTALPVTFSEIKTADDLDEQRKRNLKLEESDLENFNAWLNRFKIMLTSSQVANLHLTDPCLMDVEGPAIDNPITGLVFADWMKNPYFYWMVKYFGEVSVAGNDSRFIMDFMSSDAVKMICANHYHRGKKITPTIHEPVIIPVTDSNPKDLMPMSGDQHNLVKLLGNFDLTDYYDVDGLGAGCFYPIVTKQAIYYQVYKTYKQAYLAVSPRNEEKK